MNLNPGYLLNKVAEDIPHKTALIYKDRALDFFTLNKETNRLAHALIEKGVKHGDKVVIVLPNSIEFVEAYLAVQKIGGVAVPLDVRLSSEEIARIFNFTSSKCIITMPSINLPDVYPGYLLIVSDGVIQSNDTVLNPSDEPISVERPLEDEIVYLTTSGSTGTPKLVVLTLGNLITFPKFMSEIFTINSSDIYGMMLPMSHVSGPIVIQEMVERRIPIVIFNQIDGESILETIEKHHVSCTWGVAPIYNLILQAAKKGNYKVESLRLIVLMGMETPFSLLQELQNTFSHAAVVQGYGLTETTGPITGVPPHYAKEKLKSIGKPVSFMDIRVVDENERPLANGEYGEIIIKGPAVMKGYYKNEEATSQKIINGWLYTGDVGCFDKDGFLYISGRKDDLIITGGMKVFPYEIENVLAKHPLVKEVAVIGVPDEKRGKAIQAVIVPKSDKLTKQEIIRFCKEHLGDYKCPRHVKFVEDLPKTSTGKISRSAVRKMEVEAV